MATKDISRNMFDDRKHYKSVRLQQGRVITDDDWNEEGRITTEDRRRTNVDVIGPAGSPDDGFRIDNATVTANNQIDFDIEAGTLYLGGNRLENERRQRFRTQDDWLQGPAGQGQPAAGERFDLAYLVAYHAPVSAVEDEELFEVALGGPDTTTRERLFQRVSLQEDIGVDNCQAAWKLLQAKWAGAKAGRVNDEHELVTDAKLKVTYDDTGDNDNLCAPGTVGGYLGAENQAIRVQLVDETHLTWGFDNAAPLYRVQVDNATPQTVTLLTEPKDQAHWMLAGQIVELLPWSAVLSNGEKAAEIQGHLSRVASSYNPDTNTLTITTPIPAAAGFDNWKGRPDQADLAAGGEYYYMRVWNRGADNSSDPAIAFTPGTELTLGKTGLKITISGTELLAGDHWIIAARPETPDQVVPWDLEEGRSPHGFRRFVTPLAIIHWDEAGNATVHDCRRRFRPLTDQGVCCTFTVGDGLKSHGDFDSIEEAVQQLPSSGGKICLLPGLHETNVIIQNRVDIQISGCGKHTRVQPRPGERQTPMFRIIDSQRISLLEMDMYTVEGTAVAAVGSKPGALQEIEVAHNRILAYRNAIYMMQGQDLSVHHNIIRQVDKEGGDVAIFMLADDGLIERNDIGVVPAEANPPGTGDGEDDPDPSDPCAEPELFYGNLVYVGIYLSYIWSNFLVFFIPTNPYKTLGGIQIGSGSERITILENQIIGGAGNGITLGSDLEKGDLPPAEIPDEEPEEVTEEAANAVTLEADRVYGEVLLGERPVEGATIAFEESGNYAVAVSDSEGEYALNTPAKKYNVIATDPGYRVERVAVYDEGEIGPLVRVTLAPERTRVELADLFAFIDEVLIDRNEISMMGESGIGLPRLDLEKLREFLKLIVAGELQGSDPALATLIVLSLTLTGTLTGFVTRLTIHRNHIHDCLRNLFPLEEKNPLVKVRGVGGISLGLCEELVIRENRIESNGRNYLGPVHGIFISSGTQSDISHNQVVENGPAQLGDLQRESPGGITLLAATTLVGVDDDSAGAEMSSNLGRQAVRVHDNLVDQPVGRALTILLGMGPISVVNNHFSTGSAFAIARAGFEPNTTIGINQKSASLSSLIGVALSTAVVLIINAGSATILQQLASAGDDQQLGIPELPTGEILYSNNQVRLGVMGGSLIAQTLLSLDEVTFAQNQSNIWGSPFRLLNTLLFGFTIGASNNRFQELVAPRQGEFLEKFSLFSLGWLMNNTVNNRGNHCIQVTNTVAANRIDRGNLAPILAAVQGDCRSLNKPDRAKVVEAIAPTYEYVSFVPK